jgi:hypothetical protein
LLDGFEVFAGFKSSASIQAEAYDGADGVLLDRPNVAEIGSGLSREIFQKAATTLCA